MYSMPTIVNNAVLCTWKLFRVCINHSLAHTHTRKELIMLVMWGDGYVNNLDLVKHPIIYMCITPSHFLHFVNIYSCISEKAMAPHSSTLAWRIPWTEEPGGLQSMGSLRVGHDWVTSLLLFTFMHWRRKWQPAPVFLPGESQGQGSLVGCRLWGCTESDMTEVTWQQQQQLYLSIISQKS